jgi:prolipoprotein diacylglyceryltransferase|tara:strand:+ start:58 stop:783 length:726 start_codon:yes stop_codon:yes gene_type:complete
VDFPVDFWGVPAHLVFEIMGYAAGFALLMRERRIHGDTVDSESRAWLILAALIGALLGAKLLAFVEHSDQIGQVPVLFLGGKTVVGGLLGGTLGIELGKKILGITVRTGDVYVTPLIVSMAIGRIGCFLTGLEDATHGVHTELPWGVDFGDGPRHPTQLYGIIALGTIWLVLEKLDMSISGQRFQMFMIFYLFWRLLVDSIKDTTPVELMGLTPIQWSCILGLIWFFTYGKPGERSSGSLA